MNHTIDRINYLLVLILAAGMTACRPTTQTSSPPAALTSSPRTAESSPTPATGIAAPTPTPTPLLALSAPSATPLPPPPDSGALEVRLTDPETQQECVGSVPFSIHWGENPYIDGSGAYECAFEKQQCGEGVCILYHSAYALNFSLPGRIYPASSDYPDGSLEAGPALDFTMKQWWSDIPPETTMPFTEDNPFSVSVSDILSLFFSFEEGARAEIPNPNMPDAEPMVFVLHLSP